AGVTVDPPRSYDGALLWFTAERLPLLAAIRLAASEGFDRHAVRLASAIGMYLVRQGFWREQAATQRLALHIARRLGNRNEEGACLRSLAAIEVRLRRFDQAEALY